MGACASTPGSSSTTLAPFVPFREDELKEHFEIDSNPLNKSGKGCIYKCIEKSSGQVGDLNSPAIMSSHFTYLDTGLHLQEIAEEEAYRARP
jgi:hypothetical protein